MKNFSQLNQFLSENKQRTLLYLKKTFPALSGDDSEDVYQDSSIALYLNILNGKLTTLTSSLYTYFLRICINLSLKMLNKRSRMITVAIGDGGTGCKAIPNDVLEYAMLANDDGDPLLQEENCENLVETIVGEMSEQCRHLLIGRYVEGLSWSSIAKKCGLANADTAKSIACRYRKKVREKYQSLAKRV
ncbi:MAG: sigma-70 family RNA polymerase sigma factor [Prevotella sp.]|nr:sigma-70 family RNA polymerase sigma factor [Prevotella sp.]MBR6980968.1 sigma-70 family RNA polymerase sigma factor [Prevotella sp.]